MTIVLAWLLYLAIAYRASPAGDRGRDASPAVQDCVTGEALPAPGPGAPKRTPVAEHSTVRGQTEVIVVDRRDRAAAVPGARVTIKSASVSDHVYTTTEDGVAHVAPMKNAMVSIRAADYVPTELRTAFGIAWRRKGSQRHGVPPGCDDAIRSRRKVSFLGASRLRDSASSVFGRCRFLLLCEVCATARGQQQLL